MKLKNSYILLIAMAIFLLVSIGSVCASEDVTTDSDAQLASTDAGVVLANESNTNEDITQEKIDSNITATSDKDKFGYDEDKTVTVNVKDNESSDISNVSKNDLSVFEGNKSINFTYNNSKITILEKLAVGNHSLIINYLGNDNYTNSTTSLLLKIFGNYTLETPELVVSEDGSVKIPVKVFDGVEYIDLANENINMTLTYVDSTGNTTSEMIGEFTTENNTVLFNVDRLKFVAATVTLNYTNAADAKTTALRLASNVQAADEVKFRDTEDKNITADVRFDTEQLPVSKSDLKVIVDGAEVSDFEYNNSVLTLNSLDIGVHTLTIVYKGNDTYYTSNKTVTVKVGGNLTISPQETANVDSNKKVNITVNLSDGADPVNVDLEKLTAILTYTVGNTTLNRTIEGIALADDNQTIIFEVTESFESAYVTIGYAAENNLTGKTDIKVNTVINSEDELNFYDGEKIAFNANVTASNGIDLIVDTTNFKVYNGSKALNVTYNNSVITINDKLALGIYNLTIKFTGNSTYSDAVKNIIVNVYGIKLNSTKVEVNSTLNGEVKLDITNGNSSYDFTKDDVNVTVTYKDGNATKNIGADYTVENGTIRFHLENGNFTNATLTVNYKNGTSIADVTLNRIYNVRIEALNTETEYKTGNFTFRLIDIDDGSNLSGKSMSLSIGKSIRAVFSATTNSEGIAAFKTINLYTFERSGGEQDFSGSSLGVGVYEVELSTGGNLKSTKVNVNLTVTKGNIKIVIDPYSEYYGSSKNVTVRVTNSLNEPVPNIYLALTVDQISGQTFYLYTNGSGVGQISVKGIVGGDYGFNVKNNDTTNMNAASAKSTVTIKKVPVVINAKDVTVEYNSGSTMTIKVTKDGKAMDGVYLLVTIYQTSKKSTDYLFQTNSKGQITFSASLDVGKHKVIIKSADTRYDAKDVTKTITVKKASAKITAKKVTAYYKDGRYFTIKLTNSKTKKPIYDGKITIKVYVSSNRYYSFEGRTGMNGELKLSIDHKFKPGTYKVEVEGADNKNFAAKKVTSKFVIKKSPTKLIPKKLTAKKGKKAFFKVTVKNKKTKRPISAIKIKVKVYTGKKYKTYTLKTNKKGIAQLNVKKLKVGKHKVVITSLNKYCVAKKTKSTIKIKK